MKRLAIRCLFFASDMAQRLDATCGDLAYRIDPDLADNIAEILTARIELQDDPYVEATLDEWTDQHR